MAMRILNRRQAEIIAARLADLLHFDPVQPEFVAQAQRGFVEWDFVVFPGREHVGGGFTVTLGSGALELSFPEPALVGERFRVSLILARERAGSLAQAYGFRPHEPVVIKVGQRHRPSPLAR